MKIIGFVIFSLGIILLIGGISMPATQTQTSRTCVDSLYDRANGCVQTSYTIPNFSRNIFIFLGLSLVVSGGLVANLSSKQPEKSSVNKKKPEEESKNTATETTQLHNQINQKGEK